MASGPLGRATAADLVPVVKNQTSQVTKGHAIGTNPPFGQLVPKGSKVTLFISAGPAKTKVPSMVGFTKSAARSQLEQAGFQVTVTYDTHSTSPQNIVVREVPAGGTLQAPNSTVTIYVSRGGIPGG